MLFLLCILIICVDCIREIVGRTFKNDRDRNAFLKDYIENLCMAKDKNLLKQIVDETIN